MMLYLLFQEILSTIEFIVTAIFNVTMLVLQRYTLLVFTYLIQ